MKMASQVSKFTLNKTSPFGSAINKSLLTPCRQVGLSRKRKTPSSIVKLSTPNSKNLEDPNTTPLNHKIILPEENTNTYPSTNYEIHDDQLQRKMKKTLRVGPSGKSAKKTLIQTFSSEGFDEAHTLTKLTYEENLKNILTNTEIEELAQDCHLTKLSVTNIFSKMNSSECQSEDLQIIENDKCQTMFKSENSEEKLNQNEKITKFGSIKQTTTKKCQVTLQKLTEEDIKENISKSTSKENNHMEQSYESDDNFIKTKSKRIRVISDDESDFQNCSTFNSKLKENKSKLDRVSDKKYKEKTTKKTKPKKKYIEKTKPEMAAVKNINFVNDEEDAFTSTPDREQNENIRMISDDGSDFQNSSSVNSEFKEKKSEVGEVSNKEKSTNKTKPKNNSMEKIKAEVAKVKNISFIDDDEDAFTSTPDRERNENISLVNKIRDLEIQVKDKREKLEALKQAAIYKSKHKIPEVKSLTEIWQKGCVLALNSLLTQLQLHGPIDMSILLNNLHIPIDIAKSKLNLL